jgi:serine phosphatase RsbU (regulator of sigma subunit)
MLGYDLLEYAVKDKGLREPSEILNLMNSQIIEKLNTDHAETATDGMDLTLCRFNLDTRELVYAGAKNDLFLFSDNELTTLRVTKCSIGYSAQMEYTQSSRVLKNNDQVFLLTDGYSDQKGGPEQKKFMIRKLKNLLEEVSSLPCLEQESILLSTFEGWKGTYPQKDDVLFVGFRV